MAIVIKVNDTELEGLKDFVTALDDSMIISFDKGDKTLDAITELFGADAKIEAIVDGTTTAIYYSKAVKSIILNVTLNIVDVYLSATELQESAEDELTDRADTSDDAITELAEMMAALEERVTALEGNGTESKVSEATEEASNG